MVERIVGAEVRRGEVEVTAGDHDAHVRVHRHRLAQRLAHGGVAVGKVLPAPVEVERLQDLIRQVRLEAQVVAHVVVHRRGVGAVDLDEARVELELLAGGVAVEAGVAAVEPAHGAAFAAQQLLAVAEDLDAQVGALHVIAR